MTQWIIIGTVYVLALVSFARLGGFGAAGEAFQTWGRSRAASS